MSINRVTQTGRLTRDPELRYTPTGVAVTTINYAVDDGFGDKKKTYFFCGVAWRSTAEYIAKYARKGDLVAICGKMQERSWEKDGQKKYRTEIALDDFVLMSKHRDGGNAVEEPNVPADGEFTEVNDDELPF